MSQGGVLYYFLFAHPGALAAEIETFGPFPTPEVRDFAVREFWAQDVRKNGLQTSHVLFWLDLEADGEPCSGGYLPDFFRPQRLTGAVHQWEESPATPPKRRVGSDAY